MSTPFHLPLLPCSLQFCTSISLVMGLCLIWGLVFLRWAKGLRERLIGCFSLHLLTRALEFSSLWRWIIISSFFFIFTGIAVTLLVFSIIHMKAVVRKGSLLKIFMLRLFCRSRCGCGWIIIPLSLLFFLSSLGLFSSAEETVWRMALKKNC